MQKLCFSAEHNAKMMIFNTFYEKHQHSSNYYPGEPLQATNNYILGPLVCVLKPPSENAVEHEERPLAEINVLCS